MVQTDWKDALTRPSCTASTAALLIGVWVIVLTIINIVQGAYSPDHKVLWFGFLTGGVSNSTDMAFVLDDAFFGIIGTALIAIGYKGLENSRDDGAVAGISGFFQSAFVTDLFSSENGFTNTIASWLVTLGIGFYFYWNMFVQITWVDPGVYSVMIVFVTFGFGLRVMTKAEN